MKNSFKKIIFPLLPLLTLVLATETVCRIKYYILHNHDPAFLLAPFLEPKKPLRHEPQIIKTGCCPDDKFIFSPCRNENLLMTYHEYKGHCFRGKEFSSQKGEGVYRILTVGGSTVECVNNADEETWVYLLENKLNSDLELGGQVEVINGGKVGNNAHNISEFLENVGFNLYPDMVVYYEAVNETYSAIVDQKLRMIANSSLGWIHRKLYLTSFFYTYLVEKRQYMLIDEIFLKTDLSGVPEIYEMIRNSFQKVVRNCKKRSIEFVYVKQAIDYPLEKKGKNLTDADEILALFKKLYDESFSKEQSNSGFSLHDIGPLRQRLVNEIQTSICLEEGVLVIDPLPVFEFERNNNPEKIFTDLVHKTCYGERILSDCVYQGLREVVKKNVLHSKFTILNQLTM